VTESQEKGAKGLIQVFTGNGKGKTTAALGTVLRAAGHGFKTFIVFFFKGGYALGEYASLPLLPGVTVASYGLRHLINHDNLQPEDIEQAELALRAAGEAVASGEYDLVVMDEVNVAIEFGLIKLESVIDIINKKPEHVELILTGRYARDNLVEIADLVTEMVNIKHPFEKGITARKGLDF
jgi:cob(I)alamin adenosyltransferase